MSKRDDSPVWGVLQNLVLPDPWQREAILALQDGRDVIIDAPTGAGKTYVFEKIFEGPPLSRQAVYTVPTRALANDKYAEWKTRGWRVGLATGDTALDTSAPCLVATLEAAQGMLRRGKAPSMVVIDEYQWLADPMRGNHYEGAILSLPLDTRLLLLSGSVGNPQDVASWLERLGRKVTVVCQAKRPVPLEEVDIDGLQRGLPRSAPESYWIRRLMAALREDYGPVLVFAPHRSEAERMARQAVRDLPIPEPLTLSLEQTQILGPELTKLVNQRVAYHHSGLTYAQRAGVIEPLAKAGQLRIVVATLGLSAGINFSLRSVMITGSYFEHGGMRTDIQPHEILQMVGRAGRRGLDETGYILVSERSPHPAQARQVKLKRAAPLPWTPLLARLAAGGDIRVESARYANQLFTAEPPKMGFEVAGSRTAADFPCGNILDPIRARLVRRKRTPFPLCKECPLHQECLSITPEATLPWLWTKLKLLAPDLSLTLRGRIASMFLGPEGLAVAAAIEDATYPIEDLIFDLANVYAGDRFAGHEPRWGGRLALTCQKAYRDNSLDGYLAFGVPVQYGTGGSEMVQSVLNQASRKSRLAGDTAGVGDIDRLLIEWRSLLRQLREAPALENERWMALKHEAENWLQHFPERGGIASFPALLPEQRATVSHRLRAGRL